MYPETIQDETVVQDFVGKYHDSSISSLMSSISGLIRLNAWCTADLLIDRLPDDPSASMGASISRSQRGTGKFAG